MATPLGCIAQAWSLAETLRAHIEDVKGIRPTPPVESQPTQGSAQSKGRSTVRAVRKVSMTGTGG
jgi:glycogen debranching enzyme